MKQRRKPRIGLALGSGAARGWAHIGVLRALAEQGMKPAVVAGSSIGALVGAAYVSETLDQLEDWVRGLTWRDVVRHLDVTLSGGGFVRGERLMTSLIETIGATRIESLETPYAAVATELETGREVWLQKGKLLEAVRASIALPGLFTPTKLDDRWLVDGGLVNPVPVSVCRALGAEFVIAVNLNGGIVGKRFKQSEKTIFSEAEGAAGSLLSTLGLTRARTILAELWGPDEAEPGIFDVTTTSINIMQDRITRSRMAGDPPDVVLAPDLGHVGLMEFHRAEEAIEAGADILNARVESGEFKDLVD